MRLTLEQLKAMTDDQLFRHWRTDSFPFDTPVGCSRCLTFHGRTNGYADCHPQLRDEVLRLEPGGFYLGNGASTAKLRAHLEELYALRMFYDHLYPRIETASSLPEAVAIEGASVEVCEKGR